MNPKILESLSLDEWDARLSRVCGVFHTQNAARQVQGAASIKSLLGLDIATVCVSSSTITRSLKDAQLDGASHYFLLVQKAASSHISHNDHNVHLQAGDMLMVDSSCETQFQFVQDGPRAGDVSEQISVHIPRHLLETRFPKARVGEKIPAHSELAKCALEQITALQDLSSLLDHPGMNTEQFQTMFVRTLTHIFADTRHQNRFVRILMHLLKDGEGGIQDVEYLARLSCSSRRTFFRIFERSEISFVELLQYIRLLKFLKLSNGANAARQRVSISQMVYDSGFRDISNFNHLFKATFGVSPKMLMSARDVG
ncbi:MAG: helix-turn-helix domain-containing protein [Betaproteobacteria bacterium]